MNRANERNAAVQAIDKPPGWRTVRSGILQTDEASGKRLDTSGGTYVRSKEEAITGQKQLARANVSSLIRFQSAQLRRRIHARKNVRTGLIEWLWLGNILLAQRCLCLLRRQFTKMFRNFLTVVGVRQRHPNLSLAAEHSSSTKPKSPIVLRSVTRASGWSTTFYTCST